MKKFKKFMSVILTVVMVFSTFSLAINTFAKSDKTTNEVPLEVQITADKPKYGNFAVADFTVTVTNISDDVVENISAEVIFDDLTPVKEKTSETFKEVESLNSGESFSFSYKAMLSLENAKMCFISKIILWLSRAFNGAYVAQENSFADGRAIVTQNKTIAFGNDEYSIGANVYYTAEIGPDDATDEEDTEITEDAVYKLSASEMDVVAESNTLVTFYVNSNLTVPYFDLYCDGSSTGIKLYDDGDYSSHNDDIPNDGCYTGVLNIDYSVEKDYIFTAKAVVGETEIKTNEVNVFVYYELTDEQSDEIDIVNATFKKIISDVKAKNTSATEEELIDLLYDAVASYCDTLVEENIICNVVDDKENYIFSFKYKKSGVLGAVQYFDRHDTVKWQGGNDFSNAISSGTQNMQPNGSAKNVEYVTFKEKALLLCYDSSVNGMNGGSQEDVTNNLADILGNSGFEVTTRFSATVDDYKNMQEYAFIHVSAHGSYYTYWKNPFSNEKTPVICTSQASTKENRKQYSADLKKGNIVDEGDYLIRPSFFSKYYESNPLKAQIVALGCCKGAFTDELANSIVNVGAETVLAYSDIVYTAYDYMMSEDIVDSLLDGNTVASSVQTAQNENGANDIVWGANQRDSGNTNFNTLKPEVATMRIFGSNTTKIHSALQNGSLDNLLGFSDIVYQWHEYGDARSIMKLSGISPLSSPKMAIISSGFGSLNGETTSFIYQTFLVPNDANNLVFSYDVVSEEPMEYVGSQFNDEFKVELLDTNGKLLETLAYESVNTSTWHEVSGIDFPGGDDTTYHTRWQTVTSEAISKYRGKLIVIKFTVEDAGDAIYDTATLIDSVTIN